jgi:ribosomal protein S18 acetylase RimI-like enzyme
MTAGVRIRHAIPEDAPVAAGLIYEASFGYRDTIFGEGEDAKRLAQEVLSRVFQVPGHSQSYSYSFVAEDEEGVCGMFSGFDSREKHSAEKSISRVASLWVKYLPVGRALRLVPFGLSLLGTSAPLDEESYYVGSLAVLPEKRRQGIGRRLIMAAEENATSKGLKYLALDVVADNITALAFYERLGFKAQSQKNALRLRIYHISGIIRMVRYILTTDMGEEYGNKK